ncbi:hypothetical protein IWQ61_009023 [Dispira simplex]|nr:hypothetical protein IWQ61_009023 [Dispira simplex]
MPGKTNTEFPNIQRMFREFNREAFWGTLDEVKLEWVDDLGPGTEGTCTANTSTNTTSIQLSKRALQSKSPGRVAEVLARQMVHAYLHSTHAVDADKTDGPGFQKHWKRLLNLRDEYNRKQSDTLKTTRTSASSGKIGRSKPGSTLSSGRDKGKAPTWNFRPGARAHERKPEVVSSDDEEVTYTKRPNPTSKPPFWTSFGPSTSKSEDPVTRSKPSSSNKGKAPTWNFHPGARAHERKPEVVSSDDEEVTYTKRPNPTSKPPFWTSFGPSTSKSEDPITPPRPTMGSIDAAAAMMNHSPAQGYRCGLALVMIVK